jgi:hypothetical protein
MTVESMIARLRRENRELRDMLDETRIELLRAMQEASRASGGDMIVKGVAIVSWGSEWVARMGKRLDF